MRFFGLAMASLVSLGAGCAGAPLDIEELSDPDIPTIMTDLTLTTEDDVSLAATYYPSSGEMHALLLHMMPATKESWEDFAITLQSRGMNVLAFDQRGHGESEGGPNGYEQFSDEEQQAKMKDVRAAWEELQRRGATAEHTVVVGASIGANLAIRFLLEETSIPAAVALSPGLDYRGVSTTDAVQGLGATQHVLLVASREDEYAYQSCGALNEANLNQTELIQKEGLGHGTNMLDADPVLTGDVIEWIERQL